MSSSSPPRTAAASPGGRIDPDLSTKLRALSLLGFLYFSGHDGSFASHKKKLAARTRSLLVPYLVWSA